MKKKNKVVLLIAILLLLTGCGSSNYIKDKDNKIVINESTGQNLQKNIFCKPSEGTDAYKLYEEYEKQMPIKLAKLPKCENFKITSNKTKSLWQFLFVKPLAYLILKLGYWFKSLGMTKAYLGLSLILIGLAIRLIILPFNIKTQNQSKRMQKAAPEIQRLEKKYAGRNDQEALLMKSQEQMAIYKKYKVSPFLSCILALIQLPVFFAFLEAINKIPAIYEGKIFGWNLGVTPSIGMSKYHDFTYLILVVLIALTTYFSFNYTMNQNKSMNSQMPDAGKQMKTMLIVMTVLITFTSFTLPTAIALYWIVTYAFIVVQTFLMNYFTKIKEQKEIKKKKGNIHDKIKMKEGMKYGKNN